MIESQVSQVIPSEKLKLELCKKVSEKLGISMFEVEMAVNFQFKDIREATGEYATIEIARLGRLTIKQAKVKKVIDRYILKIEAIKAELQSPDLTGQRKYKLGLDLDLIEGNLAYTQSKIREAKPKRAKMKKKENVVIEDHQEDTELI